MTKEEKEAEEKKSLQAGDTVDFDLNENGNGQASLF